MRESFYVCTMRASVDRCFTCSRTAAGQAKVKLLPVHTLKPSHTSQPTPCAHHANEFGTHAPLFGAKRKDMTPDSYSTQFIRGSVDGRGACNRSKTGARIDPTSMGLCLATLTRVALVPAARVAAEESVESDV